MDHERHLINISSDNKGDDKILNCCLQVRDHVRRVFLFTNDINLYNRATASGVEGVTPDTINLRLNTLIYGIDDGINSTEAHSASQYA
jgi:predicted ribonuclease YlaK